MPKDQSKTSIPKSLKKTSSTTVKKKVSSTSKKVLKKMPKKIEKISIPKDIKEEISSVKNKVVKKKSQNPILLIATLCIAASLIFMGIQIGQTNGNIDDELLEAKIQKIVLQNMNNINSTKEKSKLDYVSSISDDDHVYGDSNATISLIEYSNFDCGYCRKFHTTAKDLVDTYKGKLNWTYRNSISSTDEIAMTKALTAECVAEISGGDKYWDFISLILNTRSTSVDAVLQVGEKVGANKNKLKTCIQKDQYSKKIKGEITDFMLGGMRGTPANVIRNNKTGESILIEGALPKDKFEAIIDRML